MRSSQNVVRARRVCLLTATCLLFSGLITAKVDERPRAHRAAPLAIDKAVQDVTFYSSALTYFFEADFSSDSLQMSAYDSTTSGGVIKQVTGCFYNTWVLEDEFRFTLSVEQNGAIIESKTFSRMFPPGRHTCHTQSGYNAAVQAGEFSISALYFRSDLSNLWAGLSATASGQTFDVQIGPDRPPSVETNQGQVQIRGVGLGYRIIDNEGPPLDPGQCIPAASVFCVDDIPGDGRFKVEGQAFLAGNPAQFVFLPMAYQFTDVPTAAAFYFNTPSPFPVPEGFVSIRNKCSSPAASFSIEIASASSRKFSLTVTDTQMDISRIYENPNPGASSFFPVDNITFIASCL